MKENRKTGLWSIVAPVKTKVYTAMLLSALSVVFMIFSLLILSFAFTSLLQAQDLIIFGLEFTLVDVLIVLAILLVGSMLLKSFAFGISHLAAFKLEEILRRDLSQHFAQLSLGYIISSGAGALKKVLQDDVKNLHIYVADNTPVIAKSIVAPVITSILLLVIDYRFALASFVVLIFGYLAMGYAMRDSKVLRVKYEQSQAEINKAVIEFVQAMPVVRTFDDGSSSFSRYQNALKAYKENLYHWMDIGAFGGKLGILISSPLPTLITVTALAVYLASVNSLDLFAFVSALFLSTTMAGSLMPLMWMSYLVRKSSASAIKIQEILHKEAMKAPKESKKIQNYDIEFENVSFKYENRDELALKNINLTIKALSKTALVGPSGAGKSTVAKLIPRFWDIDSGSIKIGGIDIRDLSYEELMKHLSFVFQDSFLFNDTILNNIKMAKENATNDEVINACKVAQIHDFIDSLPNGYETMVGDRGSALSGGQKQRIAIARAILKNSPIVVLDEATAFSDPENEEEIVKALANLTVDKSVIMIAHRLPTIKNFDKIVVFDGGEIVEVGTHSELLANKSVYSKLWESYENAKCWNLKKGDCDA